MEKETSTIPFQAVQLIIGYLHNSLTNPQKDELDAWITASDDNMKMFSDLTSGVDNNVFDPDQLMIETEEAIDLWIIAGLIIRRRQGLNNEVEEQYLNEWVNACKRNKKLFKELQHPAFMQKMLVWNRMQRNNN